MQISVAHFHFTIPKLTPDANYTFIYACTVLPPGGVLQAVESADIQRYDLLPVLHESVRHSGSSVLRRTPLPLRQERHRPRVSLRIIFSSTVTHGFHQGYVINIILFMAPWIKIMVKIKLWSEIFSKRMRRFDSLLLTVITHWWSSGSILLESNTAGRIWL